MTMDANGLRAAIAAIGWSQRGLAKVFDMNERETRRMATNELEIPPEVEGPLNVRSAPRVRPADLRPMDTILTDGADVLLWSDAEGYFVGFAVLNPLDGKPRIRLKFAAGETGLEVPELAGWRPLP